MRVHNDGAMPSATIQVDWDSVSRFKDPEGQSRLPLWQTERAYERFFAPLGDGESQLHDMLLRLFRSMKATEGE